MTSAPYQFPVAISRLSHEETTREPQNLRAIRWLLEQHGRGVVVVTPQKQFSGESLQRLVSQNGVAHATWRGLSAVSLAGRRVLCAWPDRKRLNDLWGVEMDALAVIEWNESETAEWIADVNPIQLYHGRTERADLDDGAAKNEDSLPNGVEGILEYVASMAAGYSSGLKWNEEDMLKADMMNRPERWIPITVERVRAKCKKLGMSPNDIDTISGFLQHRKAGRRFNICNAYRIFQFK